MKKWILFVAIFLISNCFIFSAPSEASIPRLMQVTENVYRGGQPQTFEDYQLLKNLGVRVLINLRDNSKDNPEFAKSLGLTLLNFPMNGMRVPNDLAVRKILDLLKNGSKGGAAGKFFVHCLKGKDRTGLIIAMYRVQVLNWNPRAAYNEWVSYGYNRLLFPLSYFFWTRAFFT
jgi:protein tyrosine/serine phosphatase